MKFWLMKSEPEVYSIDTLSEQKESLWEGVRNYQARNFMMNEMKLGDLFLFYHSSCEPPGVAGLGVIKAGAIPDPTQFDKKSEYYDAKSTLAKPRWSCVRVGFKEKFKQLVPLADLRADPALKNMLLLRPGQRLSIQPVTKPEFDHILKLAHSQSSAAGRPRKKT